MFRIKIKKLIHATPHMESVFTIYKKKVLFIF